MNAWLDDLIEFEENFFRAKTWGRDSIERGVAGLDGKISIDLGMRGRAIVQRGVLRGCSAEQLSRRVQEIYSLMDGSEHRLVRGESDVFDNLRIDWFEAGELRVGGASVWCEFEVRYTQLRDR